MGSRTSSVPQGSCGGVHVDGCWRQECGQHCVHRLWDKRLGDLAAVGNGCLGCLRHGQFALCGLQALATSWCHLAVLGLGSSFCRLSTS